MDQFLAGVDAAELTGWLAQLKLEDEFARRQMSEAIRTVLMSIKLIPQGGRKEEEEEVIDTTDPNFAKEFKGFINTPGPKPAQSFQGFGRGGTQIIQG